MKPYPPEFMSIFQRPARRAVGVQCLILHFGSFMRIAFFFFDAVLRVPSIISISNVLPNVLLLGFELIL